MFNLDLEGKWLVSFATFWFWLKKIYVQIFTEPFRKSCLSLGLAFFSPLLVYLEAAIWYYSSVWVPFWLLLWLLVVVSEHSFLRKDKSAAVSNLTSHTWVVLSSHDLYMPTSSVVAFEIWVVLSLHNNTITCLKDVLHLLLRCHFYNARCPLSF